MRFHTEPNIILFKMSRSQRSQKVFVPMNISESDLSELKCTKCDHYLSTGPITCNYNGDFFCGRCPNKERVQLKIYEVLAKNFSFPCCYQQFGCQEIIKWNSVREHEEQCDKVPHCCPMNDCSWIGAVSDIKRHFQQIHATEVINKNIIEIKLHKDVEEYKLIKANYNCYIFYVYFNRNQKELKMNVTQLIDSKSFKAQNYQLTLHAHDFSKHIALATEKLAPYSLFNHNNIKEENEVDMNLLKFLMNDDNQSLFCEIKFDTNEKKKTAKIEVYGVLECPVCCETMASPIYVCQTGHSYCSSCTSKLNDCPLCHKQLTKTRNYALEDLSRCHQTEVLQNERNTSTPKLSLDRKIKEYFS